MQLKLQSITFKELFIRFNNSKQGAKAKEDAKGAPTRPNFEFPELHEVEDFLPTLMRDFANVKLLRDGTNKINAEKTFKAIEDEELQWAIHLMSQVNSRAKFYTGPAKENTRWCA